MGAEDGGLKTMWSCASGLPLALNDWCGWTRRTFCVRRKDATPRLCVVVIIVVVVVECANVEDAELEAEAAAARRHWRLLRLHNEADILCTWSMAVTRLCWRRRWRWSGQGGGVDGSNWNGCLLWRDSVCEAFRGCRTKTVDTPQPDQSRPVRVWLGLCFSFLDLCNAAFIYYLLFIIYLFIN